MSKAGRAIKDILKKEKMTQTELARRMGVMVQSINQQLNRQIDMKVSRFEDLLDYIGYEMRLERLGFKRVSPSYGKELIESEGPDGLFWYKSDSTFTGIERHSEDGGPCVHVVTFDSAKELGRWLTSRCGKDTSGYFERRFFTL